MNNLLVEVTGGERFMTMLLMTVDAKSGQMRWATAGHEPPFLYDASTDRCIELGGSGLPLGIMEGENYEVEQMYPADYPIRWPPEWPNSALMP